jgi:inorganic pyrophosphatase
VALALLWAGFNAYVILKINPKQDYLNTPQNANSEKEALVNDSQLQMIELIGQRIQRGADAFLYQEYLIMLIFIGLFGVIVFLAVDLFGSGSTKVRFYATVAYICGSLTSMLCGFIGMKIATLSNYRTTYKAISSLEEAFAVAYRAGTVMGFSTVGLALGVLTTLLIVYLKVYDPVTLVSDDRSYSVLMDLLSGYGLGGSTMALFGRVGGGIYTKAADVGADLVGKVENDLEEDSPRNPATIADNVGDNVGDIAGMGSDLFGSLASSCCSSLVLIASNQSLIMDDSNLYLPLMIFAGGIASCFVTSIVGIYLYKVSSKEKIHQSLNLQLLISTVLQLGVIIGCIYILPARWNKPNSTDTVKRWYVFICIALGLISGFLIGISTDYYTSHAHNPVREMAQACTSGAAINVIYGLALGYVSTLLPVILIAVIIIISIELVGMLGVALAAVGMLSTLSVELAIDAYGPICDNAGGISEMSELGHFVRDRTDALDAAGNTTAAVGKGFAIGSAALVGFALFGAFVTRAKNGKENPIANIELTDSWIFAGLLIGAMLPYIFSALTMKSVGMAAREMVQEVRRQFKDLDIKNGVKEPDYQRCIMVSTKASIFEMIYPGCLVIFTPLVLGFVIHPVIVAGLLPGALVSGV